MNDCKDCSLYGILGQICPDCKQRELDELCEVDMADWIKYRGY